MHVLCVCVWGGVWYGYGYDMDMDMDMIWNGDGEIHIPLVFDEKCNIIL